jgi:hypothetical protein
MISSWWFKLYTIPYLKRLLLLFCASLFFDFALTKTDFYFTQLVFLLPLVALFLKFRPGSFRQNLEFHKMSIPFSELRKVFIFDILITAFSLISLFILSVVISSQVGGYFSKSESQKYWELTPGIYFFYFILSLVMITSVCLLSMDKKYSFSSFQNYSPLKKFFLQITIFILTVLIFLFFIFLGFPLHLVYHFLLAFTCCGSIFFLMRAIFHTGINHAKIWHFWGYSLLGMILLSSTFYMTFLFWEKNLMDTRLSMKQRVNRFNYYSFFHSKIDLKTFKEIEPEISFGEKSLLYLKLDCDPSRLGLNYFLDDSKDQSRLIAFLRFGNPNQVFLEDLFINMKKRERFWSTLFVSDKIKYLAFRHWPKEKMIPLEIVEFKKSADLFGHSLKRKRSPANSRR